MGQFAPVAPIQILEAMKEVGDHILGRYHLLLAHHVLEEPERFTQLFNDMPPCTIFMDNSIVELGDAASDEKVLEACEVIYASTPKAGLGHAHHWIYPVLTDVMGNAEETKKRSTTSYNWWMAQEVSDRFWPMVVLQGDSWESFTQTADYFLLNEAFKGIAYVGIPRVLVGSLGTRRHAIRYVDAIRPDVNVHLLGFSDDVTDDVICCNDPSVEGIDSAVPIRYSYSVAGGIYTPSADIPARPKDWFEKGEWDQASLINLQNARVWCA